MSELAGVYLNKDAPLPMTSMPFAKLQVKPRKQVPSFFFKKINKRDVLIKA